MTNKNPNIRETGAQDEAQQVGLMTLGKNIVGGADVPSKLIALYALSKPPAGWVEYTAARGRFIVGVPANGTIAGTVGTALTNLQDKTHTHTGPSHMHSVPRDGWGSSITASVGRLRTEAGGGDWSATGDKMSGADGTGATGTAATSSIAPYVQLFTIQKI